MSRCRLFSCCVHTQLLWLCSATTVTLLTTNSPLRVSATDDEARTRFAEYPTSGCCPKCQIKFMEAPAA
eukprot:scaffold34899_cov44-Phaeocystis_antarctica.AAC.3